MTESTQWGRFSEKAENYECVYSILSFSSLYIGIVVVFCCFCGDNSGYIIEYGMGACVRSDGGAWLLSVAVVFFICGSFIDNLLTTND